jgi:uncharacterized protein YggT (Ycf19 family)
MIVSAYALGLIAYSLLSWMRCLQTDKARAWLARFYEPVLGKIRTAIKPVRMGGASLGLAPGVLLAGPMALKSLIIHLLPRGLR